MTDADFGLTLRKLRQQRGEKLEDVSSATGLSVAMLSRIERGERLPSPESVMALARHFGIPADDLMSETIAHRMLNRYGRPRSLAAAERLSADDLSAAPAARYDYDEPGRRLSAASEGPASAPAPLPMSRAGMAFSARPVEELFAPDTARNQLEDATRVAEVAIQSALRAVQRAMASGDEAQIAEAERMLERLHRALGA